MITVFGFILLAMAAYFQCALQSASASAFFGGMAIGFFIIAIANRMTGK